jgi:hypothetical protein
MEAQAQTQPKDWRALSEAASREQDSEKLIRLVEELNRVLTKRDILKRRYATT